MVNVVNAAIEKLREIYNWFDDRIKATTFSGVRITLPPTFSEIRRNLGMATWFCFLVTGVTGLPLLLYYRPSPWDAAYDSIKHITEDIVFGHLMRSLHYHASNGMIILSIAHAVYVYFKRLYKGRFDFLWVTGVILGVSTMLVAFTGYTLIFNDRAVEAQSIMLGITEVIHPVIKTLIAGANISDRALRLYALHIAILPVVMLSLMIIHFPRALRISLPFALGILGALFLASGVYPAELGPKFDPSLAPEFMPPEWYFLWIFSLLRTWAPVIIVGVIIPGVLILVMMSVPWLDKGRRPRITDRPVFAVMGISGIVFWIYLTVRGVVRVGPPVEQIPPLEIVAALIITIAASSAVFYIIRTSLLKSQRRPLEKEGTKFLTWKTAATIILGLVCLQISLIFSFINALKLGQNNLIAIDIGLILIALGTVIHVYSSVPPEA